jgi:membrane protease YdiL (CAAX protease family)
VSEQQHLTVLPTRAVLFVFFTSIVLVLAVYISWHAGGAAWHTPMGALLCEYALIAAVLISVGGFGLATARELPAAIGFRRTTVDWIIRALLVPPMMFALASVPQALSVTLGLPIEYFPIVAEDQAIADSGSTLLSIQLALVIVVLTPIAQEALLRGVLFGWVRRYTNFWVAAVASSIIFGFVHIDIARPGFAFVAGIVAAALYEKSKSLWPPILFHMGINAVYFIAMLGQ